MEIKQYIEYLENLNACSEPIKWSKQFETSQDAWENCERGDWMLWLLGKIAGKPGSDSRRKLVLCSAKCARTAWEWMSPEGKKAVCLAEKYGEGDKTITLKQLRITASAAYTAACAADATANAAYAADAADEVACAAAYAADAAEAAACAAADAAYAADAAEAACSAASAASAAASAIYARQKALKKCANIVREYYPKLIIKG